MSVISRNRKAPAAPRPTRRSTAEPTRRSAATAPLLVPLGLQPRASLLPQEVSIRKRGSVLRRRAIGGLLAVIVLVVVASGGAWFYSQGEQAKLTAEQTQATQLQGQLKVYGPVKQVQSDIATGISATKVGGSTDIEWGPYFAQLQSTLPAGVSLADIKATSSDIVTAFAQQPLSVGAPRVATISITAVSASLPDLPGWIDALSTLPGFIDAQPGGVTVTAGVYTATVTMNVGADAFSHRFLPLKEANK